MDWDEESGAAKKESGGVEEGSGEGPVIKLKR